MRYLVEYDGGPINGARRYYKTLGDAKRQASKYVNKHKNTHIGGGQITCRIWEIRNGKKPLLTHIY